MVGRVVCHCKCHWDLLGYNRVYKNNWVTTTGLFLRSYRCKKKPGEKTRSTIEGIRTTEITFFLVEMIDWAPPGTWSLSRAGPHRPGSTWSPPTVAHSCYADPTGCMGSAVAISRRCQRSSRLATVQAWCHALDDGGKSNVKTNHASARDETNHE